MYVCMDETKASHSHRVWTEVSFSVPHFLHVGLLLSPITYRRLLKVLCPVRRPITTLDCVLLTFRHRASFILGQAFHYSPENPFYIFNQQIYFII